MSERKTAAAAPQSVRALRLANRVRRARSELKARVADGQLSAAEVILICPSEIAGMQIAQLLASQRGWGEVRSRTFLRQVAVREDKPIGSLTDRQRQAVASQLARNSCLHPDELAPTPSPADDMTGPPIAFAIHEDDSADCLRLSLTGELDLTSAPMLEDRFARLRATKSPVRLDLSELEFIDSTGLHLLIQTVGEARIKGWPFQIEPDVAPEVMRLLRLVHLKHFVMGT